MQPIVFIPYEELKLMPLPERGPKAFDLYTPWFQIPIEIDCDKDSDVQIISDTINGSHPLTIESAYKVSWMLSKLSSYPISYRTPSNILAHCPTSWFIKDSSSLFDEPKELVLHILEKTKDWLPLKTEQRYSMESIAPKKWSWEHGSVISFAYSPMSRLYDPLSIFTVIRRFHLHHLAKEDCSFELYRLIENTSCNNLSDNCLQLICLTLRQNHFVTQSCQGALEPALQREGTTKKLVEDFIASEKGHDKLLYEALLGVTSQISPDDMPVLMSTELSIRILHYLAKSNFLGFACALDMFERDDYQIEDYLGNVLTKAGFAKAGKMLQKHKQINSCAHHEEMGIALLKNSRVGISQNQLILTLRCLELLSVSLNRVSKDIIEFPSIMSFQ